MDRVKLVKTEIPIIAKHVADWHCHTKHADNKKKEDSC